MTKWSEARRCCCCNLCANAKQIANWIWNAENFKRNSEMELSLSFLVEWCCSLSAWVWIVEWSKFTHKHTHTLSQAAVCEDGELIKKHNSQFAHIQTKTLSHKLLLMLLLLLWLEIPLNEKRLGALTHRQTNCFEWVVQRRKVFLPSIAKTMEPKSNFGAV